MNNVATATENVYELMTLTDWFGVSLNVILFALILGVYWYTFSPKRKGKLESHKFIVLNDYYLTKEGDNGKN